MYKLMMIVSYLIRQFYLPNPFESMGHQISIPIGMFELQIPPILLNMLVEPVIYAFTFMIVGIYYEKRSMPALGSFLYLMFYAIHVGVLLLMAMFNFSVMAVILIMALYFAGHISVFIINMKISSKTSFGW